MERKTQAPGRKRRAIKMAKYMVEVNNKFMVRIEIDGSACAAEHYFLDNFKGVWGALAFDQKAMKTDCFIGCMMNDEMISEKELSAKLMKLEAMDYHCSAISEELDKVRETIESFRKREAELEEDYRKALTEWGDMNKELNATRPQ
jgi:hypothetical protein